MRLMRVGGRQLFRSQRVQAFNRRLLSASKHPAVDRFCQESPIPFNLEPYRSMEIFWGYNFFRRPAPERLSTIPALILSGGRDPMFTMAMGDALAGRFVRGHHQHLPECGHLLMAEAPEQEIGRAHV